MSVEARNPEETPVATSMPTDGDIVTHQEIMSTAIEDYQLLLYAASRYAVYAAVDAQDIVQSALTRVAARAINPDLPPIQKTGPNSANQYLTKSVSNCGIDALRREHGRKKHSLGVGGGELLDNVPSTDPLAEELVAGSDTVRQAIAFLAAKNPSFADIFLCIVIKDEDREEYAVRTGMNRATIRSQIRRAKEILRDAYASGELDSPL